MVENKKDLISIDIGCGPKNNLPLYGQEIDEPTIALDIKENFINERKNHHNGNLLLADAHHLPIKNKVVDKVFLTHVLEHVNSTDQTMSEVNRITKNGSELVVAVPDSRFEAIMSKLDPRYNGPEMHQRIIRNHSLQRMVENQGFAVTTTKSRGFLTAIALTFSYIWHLKIKKTK